MLYKTVRGSYHLIIIDLRIKDQSLLSGKLDKSTLILNFIQMLQRKSDEKFNVNIIIKLCWLLMSNITRFRNEGVLWDINVLLVINKNIFHNQNLQKLLHFYLMKNSSGSSISR